MIYFISYLLLSDFLKENTISNRKHEDRQDRRYEHHPMKSAIRMKSVTQQRQHTKDRRTGAIVTGTIRVFVASITAFTGEAHVQL